MVQPRVVAVVGGLELGHHLPNAGGEAVVLSQSCAFPVALGGELAEGRVEVAVVVHVGRDAVGPDSVAAAQFREALGEASLAHGVAELLKVAVHAVVTVGPLDGAGGTTGTQ